MCVSVCVCVLFDTFDVCASGPADDSTGYAADPDKALKFVARNKRQLARCVCLTTIRYADPCSAYPAGFRVNSSNYNPVDMWNVGMQLVALNYQTHSLEMNINQARFRDNGAVRRMHALDGSDDMWQCGYVLKPQFLRDLSVPFEPNNPHRYVSVRVWSR